MLLVGKQVWFGRAILSAYVLLVCFGHALHALPGHQHGCDACACTQTGEHPSDPACEVACSTGKCPSVASQSKGVTPRDWLNDCPYGHSSSSQLDTCSLVQDSNEQATQKISESTVRSVVHIGICSICELLTSPQFAILVTDVDTAVVPLFVAAEATYLFPASPIPSLHLARGPPSIFA